ncbi:MAG TPA: hypothetical protein PLF63_15470 [Rubrivivax sp.]|jgi:hypothetical protein|nr:hypothetical protein [Rubrivivax sp.]
MLRNTLLAGLLGLAAAGTALAQIAACPCAGGNRLLGANLGNALQGNTACAVLGNEQWQEFHQGTAPAGGDLIDWKLGTGSSQPPERVGSWSILGLGSDPGGARVRYDYGTGGAYTYAVCREGASTYHFCGSNFGGRNITNASIQAGQVGCSTVSRRTR